MKTFHPGEVENLRAEVRALQTKVNSLEARLADYEEDDAQQIRALWPYNWILSGVETVKEVFDSKNKAKREPKFDPHDGEARFSRMMM